MHGRFVSKSGSEIWRARQYASDRSKAPSRGQFGFFVAHLMALLQPSATLAGGIMYGLRPWADTASVSALAKLGRIELGGSTRNFSLSRIEVRPCLAHWDRKQY